MRIAEKCRINMKFKDIIKRFTSIKSTEEYKDCIDKEATYWGGHGASEIVQKRTAWLEHPIIQELYLKKNTIDGEIWYKWLLRYSGRKVSLALDMGCGTGSRDRKLLNDNVVDEIIGIDISKKSLEEAKMLAEKGNLKISYKEEDINKVNLEKNRYDLIFSCHSFHHFFQLEYIMKEISNGLKDDGLFILEEYVGPSLFQWSDKQLELTNNMLALIPKKYRRNRTGILKGNHTKPSPQEVKNISPFEAIRSSEIVPLFYKHFNVLYHRNLGGTIQHLLYASIIHNFNENDEEANQIIKCIDTIETILIENREIPSDFALLVGKKKQ